ncbi:cytochrome P450 [Mycena leptocephala]|nr:cytochrome P450 [Mycena leptocephala]
MISDPLTVKYVLNSPIFVHGSAQQKSANFSMGFGNVFLAQGDGHRHLRNIMNPGFSAKSVRATLPALREIGRRLVDRWEALGFPGHTVDISRTLRDAALDAIGDAVLEHQFNGLEGNSELSTIQRNLLDSISNPTKLGQLADAVLPYIPEPVLRRAMDLPLPIMLQIREYTRLTDELSRQLVQQKRDDEEYENDHTFLTPFIRRNSTDSETDKGVPDEEIPVHIRTILFAGADTASGTLGWVLYKLAEMQDYQQALRKEIQLATINGLDSPDYDKMPLLNAMINEVLRFYPALPLEERMACEDYVLPLSQPINTTTGVQISEIPIKKGQVFFMSSASYHRLTSIWGPDAREFRPSRWFEEEPCKGPALGPHASLLSFSAGPGVCLGWRFAILEVQVFVTELVRKFVLSLPEDNSVRACIAVTLVSRTADGVQQLPIHIETVG